MNSTGDVEIVIERLRASGHTVRPDGRITADAAAELLGVSPKTLRNWRSGMLPPGFPQAFDIRGRIWYRLHELLDWIEAQRDEEQK